MKAAAKAPGATAGKGAPKAASKAAGTTAPKAAAASSDRKGADAGRAAAASPDRDDVAARVADVAAGLRGALTPLVEALGGSPPRPVRLIRQTGLDKSLAGRLVRAVRADDDAQFLHACPSPTGLRMLLDRSADQATAALRRKAAAAIDRFEDLLGGLPGGRQALDALLGGDVLGGNVVDIRRKREHVARQASFKAMSFLFGHYCDQVATTLFIVPSATPGKVDFVELHRRIGLQRLVADAPIALMSMQAVVPGSPPSEDACVTDLAGDADTRRPADFVLATASSRPLPPMSVVDEGAMLSFVLDPAPASASARGQLLSTAMRVLRASDLHPAGDYVVPRRFMLHTPCRTLVRDVYLAEGLWPDARLAIDFYMPGPTAAPGVDLEPGRANHRKVNLSCDATPLPAGPIGPITAALAGAPDHAAAIAEVLARTGLTDQRFRGWRCEMAYPVPLVEMQIGFRLDPVRPPST